MIFNKNGQGAAELHRLTGIYYASNDFSAIESEIHFATREVAALVGDAVVSKAENRYLSDDYSDESTAADDVLVRRVQLPIACLAIARHAGQTLVSHEDSGRKVKKDDNETLPWEWIIDRDDRALREKYCRALDTLYAYLEAGNLEEWSDSPARHLRAESIVKTLAAFEAIYPIEHSYYTYYLLLPLIVESQQLIVQPAMGDKWASITGANVAEADLHLLRLASRVAVLQAVATAVERWSLEVFPLSIARRFNPTYQGNRASTAATTAEMEWAIGKLRAQADTAMNELLSALNDGANPYEGYPLLPKNSRRNKFFNAG